MLPRACVAPVCAQLPTRAGLAVVALVLLVGGLGTEAAAGSKRYGSSYGYGSGYGSSRSSNSFYDYQRQSAQQQAEMERQQREQQRAAEQAQRDAEKQAARLQAEFEAQQRRQQEQALRDAERQRQQAQRDMDAAQRRAQQEAEQAAKRAAEQAQRAAEQAARDGQQAAQREAQRAAEASARDAQRAAQRSVQQQDEKWKQSGWDRDGRQDDAQPSPVRSAAAPRAAAPAPEVAAPQAPRAQDRADTDGDDGDVADVDLDQELQRGIGEDEVNPGLTAAERRVRELERMRRVEEQRQARAVLALKRRDAQRGMGPASDRDSIKATDNANAAMPPRFDKGGPRDGKRNDDEAAPRDVTQKDVTQGNAAQGETYARQDDGPGGDGTSGGDKVLSGWQQQAMRLGGGAREERGKSWGSAAGRDDGRDGQDRRGRRTDKGYSAKSDQDGAKPSRSKDSDSKKEEKSATRQDGATDKADRGRKSPRAVQPPPAGAELPPEQFAEEREQELIVPELSPEQLKTAEESGLVVDTPTELGKSGTKVVRVRLKDRSDRVEAERKLHQVLPFASATPNYAYKIFLGQEGQPAAFGAGTQNTAPASAEPCPESVCFGRKLINWNPEHTRCVKDVRVGVIDTSFDTSHPALRKISQISETFPVGSAPSSYDWHGTAVLSVLAGDPASGTPGLVPDATFLLAAAFRSDVNGNASTDTVRLLAALAWLEDHDVDIVNMSFSGPEDPSLARAIARMSKKGIVFIAAAGNMGPTASPSYPAAYPSVIAVTAVSREGFNYKNANRGSYIDFSAPGVDILAALPHARQGLRTGTSFAAPFVTAVVAASGATVAQGGARGVQAVSAAELMPRLPFEDIGPPGQDPIYGAGLVRAPQQCGRAKPTRGEVAAAEAVPQSNPWSTQTTTTFAGASVAP